MKNANGPRWSYSFTWVRIFLMKWFLSGNMHSSKWKCTAEITWFDQRLKAKQATFWHPTSWAAGPLGRPPQSWQELKSLAHTGCQCPAWKSSTLLASKGKRPCSMSVRSLGNFLYSHSLVILVFHSNSEWDCERITLLWIAVLFITCFTVTASCAEICTEPNCGPFFKEFIVWLMEFNSLHLIFFFRVGEEKNLCMSLILTRILLNAYE